MNGTKTIPALSPEGAASSETSETQSVTDEPLTARKVIKFFFVLYHKIVNYFSENLQILLCVNDAP